MQVSFAWYSSPSFSLGHQSCIYLGQVLHPPTLTGVFCYRSIKHSLWNLPMRRSHPEKWRETVITGATLMAESLWGQITQLHQQRWSLWGGSTSKGYLRWNPGSNEAWEELCYWLQGQVYCRREDVIPHRWHLRASSKILWILLTSVAHVGQKKPKNILWGLCVSVFWGHWALFGALWSGLHLEMWVGATGPPSLAIPQAQTLHWPGHGTPGFLEGYLEQVTWPRG